jgi:Zn-dependent protease
MNAFRIGRLLGIDIRVDWGWVFIALLMTWNLTTVFSQWHATWPFPESVGVAALASLLFFGCVLLHELAHSAVAMRFGLRVRNITLFLLGGVSNIEHEPSSATAEFSMAVVGPLTSVAVGVFLVLLAGVMSPVAVRNLDVQATMARLGPLATLLAWLGPINIVIGVFNLIPAFPLDGGRVLRAILWGLSGDLRFATVAASAVGQMIGWFFILTGIAMTFGARIPLLGAGVGNGLWLAFVGWFIHSASSQAYRQIPFDHVPASTGVDLVGRASPR